MTFKTKVGHNSFGSSVMICNIKFQNKHKGKFHSVRAIVHSQTAQNGADTVFALFQFLCHIKNIIYYGFINIRDKGWANGVGYSLTVNVIGAVTYSADV